MIDHVLAASSFGERSAIEDPTGTTTYAELATAAVELARALCGPDGVDLGEARVAVLVPPGAAWVVAVWGVWLAGGLAVPLSPQHPPTEWAYVLEDAEVSVLLVADRLETPVRAGLQTAVDAGHEGQRPRLLVVDRSGRPVVEHDGGLPDATDVALPTVSPSRRALMLYTSGTTGKPKGVVHTHASLAAQVRSLTSAWEWRPEDRTLLVLPLHHVHGVVNVMCCALAAGAHVVMHERFDADAVWQVLAHDALTLFHAVPTIWARLLSAYEGAPSPQQESWREALRRMRLLVSGSAALPVTLLDRWQALSGHVLLERYGMTEIGMALSNPLHGARVPGHVGSALPGVAVRAVDDDGAPVPAGVVGALEVRGPAVMLEYWRRPQETVDAFHDGWFRTGDVGVLEDTAGGPSWRLLGRQSTDIIKTGGYKVSALEIEEALRTHPAVAECAVVGLADDEWGERVAVAVELSPSQTLALDDVRAFLKSRLAVYKVPSALATPDALPRNAMGKVVKADVRRLFLSE
jgi:malonyl-CoA/methylmalonyl-CoA synthetase